MTYLANLGFLVTVIIMIYGCGYNVIKKWNDSDFWVEMFCWVIGFLALGALYLMYNS